MDHTNHVRISPTESSPQCWRRHDLPLTGRRWINRLDGGYGEFHD